MQTRSSDGLPPLDLEFLTRLNEFCYEGWKLWSRFDTEVRGETFHPFIAAEYDTVLEALISVREPGLSFLEWGSATGVITIMADLLGFEAYGIELDRSLVEQARTLSRSWDSNAQFALGSFLPTGYRYLGPSDGIQPSTIVDAPSGYLELGHPLEQFDVVYAFPWSGEEPMMLDLMDCYGRADALLLLFEAKGGVRMFRGGRLV